MQFGSTSARPEWRALCIFGQIPYKYRGRGYRKKFMKENDRYTWKLILIVLWKRFYVQNLSGSEMQNLFRERI